MNHDSSNAESQRKCERQQINVLDVLSNEWIPICALEFFIEILEIQLNRYRRISKMAVINLPLGHEYRLAGGNPKTPINPL